MRSARPMALAVVLALTACGGAPKPHTRVLKTVFTILLENRNWDDVKGNALAPYINNTLLPMASHAENYSNPPDVHPSLPNYLFLEAGTNFGVGNDDVPSVYHQDTTQHLVTQLQAANISWKSYQEDIDGTTCPLTGAMDYAPKHNPVVYFDDVTDNLNAESQNCISHVRPYTELAGDLTSGNVARYNFITPNLCNDGHNACSPGQGTNSDQQISQIDTWLKNNVPAILDSSAYKDGGVLFITFDESEPTTTCLGDPATPLDTHCPIMMLVLSPYAKGHGYSNTIGYDHSSTLRTVQEIFDVKPLLGGAANAKDLSDLFKDFP